MTFQANIGQPGSYITGGTPRVYAFNAIDSATPTIVAPSNPSRTWIWFINPGTIDMYVFPSQYFASVSATALSNLAATLAAPGGAMLVPANGGNLALYGQAGEFQAFAASGGAIHPLTVIETSNQAIGSLGR